MNGSISTIAGVNQPRVYLDTRLRHDVHQFDVYPATPELTLLTETVAINKDALVNETPGIRWIGIIASKDGSIDLYMVSGKKGSFFRAIIKSPN